MIYKKLLYFLTCCFGISSLFFCNVVDKKQRNTKTVTILQTNFRDSTVLFFNKQDSAIGLVAFEIKKRNQEDYKPRRKEIDTSEEDINDSKQTTFIYNDSIIFKDLYGVQLVETWSMDVPTINRLIKYSETVNIIGKGGNYFMEIKMQDDIGTDIMSGHTMIYGIDGYPVELRFVKLHFRETKLKRVEIDYNTDYKDIQIYHHKNGLLTDIEHVSYSYELDNYFYRKSKILYQF